MELLGYCFEAKNRILVYEHATMGSLHDVLHGMISSSFIFEFFFCLHFEIFIHFHYYFILFYQGGKVYKELNQVQFSPGTKE